MGDPVRRAFSAFPSIQKALDDQHNRRVRALKHECDRAKWYGEETESDDGGKTWHLWVNGDEYAVDISFCPFCGLKLEAP